MMKYETERDKLIALHEASGIGWKTIARLMDGFEGSLTKASRCSQKELQQIGIPEARAKKILEIWSNPREEHILKRCKDLNIQVITRYDPEYPERLLDMHEPPWVLYCRGNTFLLEKPSIAVVGTRLPSEYGKHVAKKLSEQLSQAGLTIVSGLARGIDGCAHQGGLKGTGSSIAVLGAGIDQVYPPEHRGLMNQLTETGLVISEYPPGVKPHAGLFPRRNRVIAGISLGTLVVEAAVRSGSLITADFALDYGRDVFAVPGMITSPKSEGALSLIRQGAVCVTKMEDIIEEYTGYDFAIQPSMKEKMNHTSNATMSGDEQKVMQLLSHEPKTFDDLLEETGLNFGHLHSVLIHLTMKNRIKQLPGSIYVGY